MAERANNFPPLPKLIKIKPCFYQNIEEEIPAPHQLLVRRVYILWLMYSGTLCLNVIGCIAWWAGAGNPANFGFSLLWLILFCPCSYTCWFRPLYKAFSQRLMDYGLSGDVKLRWVKQPDGSFHKKDEEEEEDKVESCGIKKNV